MLQLQLPIEFIPYLLRSPDGPVALVDCQHMSEAGSHFLPEPSSGVASKEKGGKNDCNFSVNPAPCRAAGQPFPRKRQGAGSRLRGCSDLQGTSCHRPNHKKTAGTTEVHTPFRFRALHASFRAVVFLFSVAAHPQCVKCNSVKIPNPVIKCCSPRGRIYSLSNDLAM